MSESVTGFVVKINQRNVNTRRGPSTSYSLRLEDENGAEINKWFSAGFKKPPVSEGDFVKLSYSENDRGFLDISEIKPLKNGPARSGKSATSGTGAARDNSAGRDERITYLACQKVAEERVRTLLDAGALPVSEAKTKAGTSKRFDEIAALVAKITVQLYHDAMTLRLLKSVADAGKDAEKAAALPDDEDEEIEDDGDDEEDDE